jgi:hypothetical protein
MKRSEAIAIVSAIVAMREDATDAQASKSIQIYPTLKENGALVKAGTRINWSGKLKRAAVDLWDTKENNPDNASMLWEDIAYRNGFRVIPEVITAILAFSLGECGWWKDVLYKSKINANVYTPEQYSNGWEIVNK